MMGAALRYYESRNELENLVCFISIGQLLYLYVRENHLGVLKLSSFFIVTAVNLFSFPFFFPALVVLVQQ